MSYVNVVHNTVFWSIQTWTWFFFVLKHIHLYGVQIGKTVFNRQKLMTSFRDVTFLPPTLASPFGGSPSLRRSDLGKGKEISGIREILGWTQGTWMEHGKMDEVIGWTPSTKKMSSSLSNWDVLFVNLWPQGFDLWIPSKPQARWWGWILKWWKIFPTKGWVTQQQYKKYPGFSKCSFPRLHQALREEAKTIIVCSLGLRKQPKMRKLWR